MSDNTRTKELGGRLRRIRNQQGLSLAQVEERSHGVWKAVVVGAYERGDRTVSLQRLADLAGFYGVPLGDLLPDESAGRATVRPDGKVTLDLTRLDPRDPRLAPVARFAAYVRRRRGDHNGRLLTLRGGDLQTIALAIGRTPEQLLSDLEYAGIVRTRPGEPSAITSEASPPAEMLRARPRYPGGMSPATA